jgi:glycerol uptake facilitator-like aquaporin
LPVAASLKNRAAKQDRVLLVVWAVLVGVTLLSWALGANNGHTHFARNPAITWGVLLIAAFKVRMIVRSFMEVSHAPSLLRRVADL